MRDVIFRCRRHIGRPFGAAGAGLPFNPYRGRTVATIAAMGFDPEEARRRIMPAHDAKVARYRAVMDALESAIDRAHQEITRRDYAHGGTIAIWGDAGTPNIQRVAWQFGEIASSSDGPRYGPNSLSTRRGISKSILGATPQGQLRRTTNSFVGSTSGEVVERAMMPSRRATPIRRCSSRCLTTSRAVRVSALSITRLRGGSGTTTARACAAAECGVGYAPASQ